MGWFTFLLENGNKEVVKIIEDDEEKTLNVKFEEFPKFLSITNDLYSKQVALENEFNRLRNSNQVFYKNFLSARKKAIIQSNKPNSFEKITIPQENEDLLKIENKLREHDELLKNLSSVLEKLLILTEKNGKQKTEAKVITEIIREKAQVPKYLKTTLETLQNTKIPLNYDQIAKAIKRRRKTVINYVNRLKEYGHQLKIKEDKNGVRFFAVK